MKELRRKFNRFCIQNRNKGIPNLMLYICLGSAVVSFFSMVNGGSFLYDLLCFDKTAILNGQVWRLVSWLFTEQLGGSGLLSILFLYFFYRLGSAVEHSIGTFKFNLFYLSGVVLMDLFAMIFCPTEAVIIGNKIILPEAFTMFYGGMAYYLHLSMVLAFSTMYPESQFMVLFIIPIKAWVLALVDLVLIFVEVFNLCYPMMLFPHCLFPLIGLLNYFIFFGSDMHNLLPLAWRVKLNRARNKKAGAGKNQPKVIPFTPAHRQTPQAESARLPYSHRCTVCGKTDVDAPELEFRYCSRCKGYYCYCEEHISNHTHVE